MTGPKTRILMKKQPPERATKGRKPMKKLMSIAMILVTVFALMIPVFSAGAEGEREMWINCADGKTLNLRAEPSKQAARIRRLECGTKLIVLSDAGNGWLNVTDGKNNGYVMAKYLQDNKPGKYEITEREDHFTSVTPFTVTAKALNSKTERSVGLRTKPNKTSAEIRRLNAGDQLEVIARGATWSQVLDPQTGNTGYAANDYLQF